MTEWRKVVGNDGWEENYLVSDDGRVFSLISNRELKPYAKSRGYGYKRRDYTVSITHDGKQRHPKISRMVAMAFIPNPLNKEQVNHIDGNPLNNHVSNLEWTTDKENRQHAVDNWLTRKGFTKEQFEQIKELSLKAYSVKDISAITGVHPHCVKDIRRGVNHNDVEFVKAFQNMLKSIGLKKICDTKSAQKRLRLIECNDQP